MILGHISNVAQEAATLPARLARGLRFLAETDFTALAAGRIEIDGEAIFALVQDYETTAKANNRAEAHRRYIDIQFVAAGSEIIGYAPLLAGMAASEDHLASPRDIAFYDAPGLETDLHLPSGGFAVFFPWDIHRPRCVSGAPTAVRKVVVKVAVGD